MADKLSFRFEFDKGTDLQQAADTLRERVSKVAEVEQVDLVPEKPRITGLEIVAAIAVGIEVVQGVRKGITELRKLVHELKALSKEVHGLQDVKLEVGPRKVPLDQVSDADLEELAHDSGTADQPA